MELLIILIILVVCWGLKPMLIFAAIAAAIFAIGLVLGQAIVTVKEVLDGFKSKKD